MDQLFSEQNIGLFFMGLFFIAFALFATYKANEQERKERESRSKRRPLRDRGVRH